MVLVLRKIVGKVKDFQVEMNDILTKLGVGDTLSGTNLLAYVTFGRDIARFHQLIEFLTWISIILWCFVVATTLLRAGVAVIHTRFKRRYSKQSLPGRMPSRDHGNS
jgi:hypothetical protein